MAKENHWKVAGKLASLRSSRGRKQLKERSFSAGYEVVVGFEGTPAADHAEMILTVLREKLGRHFAVAGVLMTQIREMKSGNILAKIIIGGRIVPGASVFANLHPYQKEPASNRFVERLNQTKETPA